jgi:hypothetical protein
MDTQLTQEDYKNIIALINRADIKGNEAMAIAVLQQKIVSHIKEEPVEKTKEDSKK